MPLFNTDTRRLLGQTHQQLIEERLSGIISEFRRMKSGPYIIDDFAVLIMKEGTEILSVADSMSTISSILETSCKVVLPDLIPSGPDGLWIIVITTETEECFKDEETISCVRIEVGESTYLN